MSLESGTASTDELVALYQAVAKLEVMLREYNQGDATATKPGRFTAAQIDAQIADVSDAITAIAESEPEEPEDPEDPEEPEIPDGD